MHTAQHVNGMTHFNFVVHSGKLVKIYARLLGTPYAISNQQMEEKRQKTMVTKKLYTMEICNAYCSLCTDMKFLAI